MGKKRVRVHVVAIASREHLMMRYQDPVTQKRVHRTAGTADRKEAERAAQRWEDELATGKFVAPEDVTWQQFRDRFEDEHLAFLSDGYFGTFQAALNLFEKKTGIRELSDVADVLGGFELSLRRSKLSPNTVRSYLNHLKVALAWGADRGLIERVKLKLPDGTDDVAKGRALTQAEFESMLLAVPAVVGREHAATWRHYLTGLWLSGLRRTESLKLSWDAAADFSVDLSGLYPRWKIRAAGQKSRKAQLVSMAKDCADFLLASTVPSERAGLVFCPVGRKGGRLTTPVRHLSSLVAEISTSAEVFTDSGKTKPAGCHDLRRSFGTRWASILMPIDLKALMRHADINTTLKYYVSSDSDTLSARIWAKMADAESTAATDSSAAEEARNRQHVPPGNLDSDRFR